MINPRYRCEEEVSKAIATFLKERSLPKDSKIFTIIGHYDDMRQEFLRRGWVEHEHDKNGVNDKFKSNAFHYLYTTKSKDIFRIPNLALSQYVNHFEGTKALTTKVGLTHNMKNLIWRHQDSGLDIDAFFPQSYDLSDLKGDEVKDFQEDYRYCQVIGFLKTAVDFNKAMIAKNLDKIMIALSICERRIALNSDEIFTSKELQTNADYFKCISDEI